MKTRAFLPPLCVRSQFRASTPSRIKHASNNLMQLFGLAVRRHSGQVCGDSWDRKAGKSFLRGISSNRASPWTTCSCSSSSSAFLRRLQTLRRRFCLGASIPLRVSCTLFAGQPSARRPHQDPSSSIDSIDLSPDLCEFLCENESRAVRSTRHHDSCFPASCARRMPSPRAVLRLAMILAGTTLIEKFRPLLLVFAGILIFSAYG